MLPVQISITRKDNFTFRMIVMNELEIVKSFDAHADTINQIVALELAQLVPVSGKVHVR